MIKQFLQRWLGIEELSNKFDNLEQDQRTVRPEDKVYKEWPDHPATLDDDRSTVPKIRKGYEY